MAGRKKRRQGSRVEGGSKEARRLAMVILEVLGGVRSPTEAGEALGVSATRYYTLEQRALVGLVEACEPRDRGPRKSLVKEVERLEKEVERLTRECARRQALLRLAQRAAGVPAPKKSNSKKPEGARKKGRKKKPTTRALKAAEHLRGAAGPAGTGPAAPATTGTEEKRT